MCLRTIFLEQRQGCSKARTSTSVVHLTLRRRGRHACGVALVLDVHLTAHTVHVSLSALHQWSMNLSCRSTTRPNGISAVAMQPARQLFPSPRWAQGTYAAGAALGHQGPPTKKPLANTHRHAPAHVRTVRCQHEDRSSKVASGRIRCKPDAGRPPNTPGRGQAGSTSDSCVCIATRTAQLLISSSPPPTPAVVCRSHSVLFWYGILHRVAVVLHFLQCT